MSSATGFLKKNDSPRSPRARCRRHDVAFDVLARRARLVPLAEVNVSRVLRPAHLERLGDRLLLCGVGFAREIVAQLLDLRVARPAEQRLLAARIQEGGGDGIE